MAVSRSCMQRCTGSATLPPAGPCRGLRLPRLASALAAACLALCVRGAAAAFYSRQDISAVGITYCGYYEITRYKAWCNGSNINAWIGSNLTCSQSGSCQPSDLYASMSCSDTTYCDRQRSSAGSGTAVGACLVVQSTSRTAGSTCDIDITGPSISDEPEAPPSAKRWATWKTLTIIFSILGFALLLVLVYLVVTCCVQQHTARTAPVKTLTNVMALDYAAHGGGGTDMVVTLHGTLPGGKPVLFYPSVQPVMAPLVLPAVTSRLQPNAGDELLRAAAASRPAANGSPSTGPAVLLPPSYGLPPPPPSTSGGASTGTYGGLANGAYGPYAGSSAGVSPSASVEQRLGGGRTAPVPQEVYPSALMPPTAATLQNPRGTGDVLPPPLPP